MSDRFNHWCAQHGIDVRLPPLEAYGRQGRVERAIGILKDIVPRLALEDAAISLLRALLTTNFIGRLAGHLTRSFWTELSEHWMCVVGRHTSATWVSFFDADCANDARHQTKARTCHLEAQVGGELMRASYTPELTESGFLECRPAAGEQGVDELVCIIGTVGFSEQCVVFQQWPGGLSGPVLFLLSDELEFVALEHLRESSDGERARRLCESWCQDRLKTSRHD